MFRFFALLLALTAVAHGGLLRGQRDVGRIVGGTDADIEDIPYQLSLRYYGTSSCGASLISEYWAVSAAHCTSGIPTEAFSLLAGTSNRLLGGQIRDVVEVIDHPEWNPARDLDNDICLVRVETPFVFGIGVQPIKLPAEGAPVVTGSFGLTSGWGLLSEGGVSPVILQQVWLPVVDQEICNSNYFGMITDTMVCAGFPEGIYSSCQQDSGGPFAIDGELIGVVSFGMGCARPNFPGVYARVPAYRAWIAAVTGV